MRNKIIAERDRLASLLPSANPKSQEYAVILANIYSLTELLERLKEEQPIVDAPGAEAPKAVIPEPLPDEPPFEPTPKKTVKKKTEEPKAEAPSRDSVRAKLAEASGKGISIQPIIEMFVPENKPIKFSEIPASSYPDLLEVLANAQ